ncbi:MAG: phage tail tip lysozyme [Acinetobacter sp.]
MASLQQNVMKAFMKAGLSENQARIMTAEVGRENSFDPSVVFGVHPDDKNKKTNVGLLSWQNGREAPLLARLKSNGLYVDGKIQQSQESLDEMAKYAVHEINTKPEYAATKKTFLSNPDVDYNTATKVLGTNFIKWRYNDPEYKSGHKNRDDFYRQLGGNPKTWNETKAMVGEIKPPNRKPAQNRINQLVATYDKQVKANTTKNQINPQQKQDRVNSLLATFDKQNPARQATPVGIPDFDENGVIREDQPPQPKQQQAPLSTMDKIIGGTEAGLTVATGVVGGVIGQAAGGFHGIAESVVDGTFGTQQGAQNALNRATQASNALTYQPKTAGGQRAVGAVGEFIDDTGLDTLPPVLGGGVGTAAATLGRASVPVATTAAREVAQAAKPVVAQAIEQAKRPVNAVTEAAKNIFNRESANNGPAPANIGAAQVDQATIRQALAADLPFTPELTRGQISRDPAQLKFEVETAKNAEMGAPLRQRYEDQHLVIQQNIDHFIESTDGLATNMREAGIAVDTALQKQMKADKNRVRVAYNKADNSSEAQTPVDLTTPINNGGNPTTVLDYLNSQPDLPTTPILATAKKTAVSLGIAEKDPNGSLISKNPNIKQMEQWRSQINQNVNAEAPNIRQAAILKSMIDEHIGPAEGALYKAARAERVKVAKRWENTAIMHDLTNKKANSSDRIVALEDVQKRIIHDGSLDDLRVARRALLTSGEEGKQAWKDIQGQTLQEIKNAATAGIAPDARGNQMISPAALNKAIKRLDDSGKLDFIFGQQGAEKLRSLNEISKTIFTVPASAAINHSNTAATLSAAMDLVLSGMSGFPAPVASALRMSTKHIKDRKIRKRVEDALNPRS